jgi:hypothetical protein
MSCGLWVPLRFTPELEVSLCRPDALSFEADGADFGEQCFG